MSNQKTPVMAAIWSFIDSFSRQGISFVLGIILARLLSPDDYGNVGVAMVFLSFANVLIDAGFTNALVRKLDRTEEDLSTAFYFNISASILCYVILWLLAPFIADYFNLPAVKILIRVIGLSIVLSAFGAVQNMLYTAKLDMRTLLVISILSQVPAGFVAIALAYLDYGVYALAIQALLSAGIRTVLLWQNSDWRPSSFFNRKSFSYLWGFGSKLVGANLIGVTFQQVNTFLIGKYFGSYNLGYYSKSSSLSTNVNGVTEGIISRIAMPVLSRHQDDLGQLRSDFREIMRLLVLISAPLCIFLFYISDDLIVFLWSEKWLQSSIYFKLLILGVFWIPVGDLSQLLMHVMNRTDIVLKMEIPKKLVYTMYIFICFKWGIIGLCVSQILTNLTASLVNMYPTKNLLGYNYFEQLIDILKYIGGSFLIGYIVSFLPHCESHLLYIIYFFGVYSVLFYGMMYLLKDSVTVKYVNKLLVKKPVVKKYI